MITREQLRSWRACYSDERIAELVPPEGVTLAQVLDSDIPHKDKIWVADHILPRVARLEWRARLVERCIGYGSLTDERITCLPAALRSDAVTPEIEAAAWALEAAREGGEAAKAAWAWAARAAAYATYAAYAAAAAASAATDPEAERKQQLDDIRELAG